MRYYKFLRAVVLFAGSIGLGGAQASVINFAGVNDTGSILYSTTQSGANLSATVTFTLLNPLSANSATFGVSVSNNSSGLGANTLTSFGIDIVSPGLKSASTTGSWGAGLNTTLPNFAKVDLCLWAGNNCSGGGNQGLAEGMTNTFTLTLTTAGNFLTDGISFGSPYGVKFQTVGNSNSSFEFSGCVVGSSNCGNGGNDNQVPEPASIALVALGLLAALLVLRRRQAGRSTSAFNVC